MHATHIRSRINILSRYTLFVYSSEQKKLWVTSPPVVTASCAHVKTLSRSVLPPLPYLSLSLLLYFSFSHKRKPPLDQASRF